MRPWLTALAVVAASVPRGAAARAPGGRAYVPVRVQTDFAGQEPQWTERVQPALQARVQDVLKHEHGMTIAADASTIVIVHVRSLEEKPGVGAVQDYGVRVEVQVDGDLRGDEVVPCAEQGEAELVECATRGIGAVLAYVPTEARPATVAPTVAADAEERPPAPRRHEAAIGGVGVSGIVLGAGGLATVIAGAVDLGRGEQSRDEVANTNIVDFRPRGRALLGVGLGLIAVGAVLVAVDVGVRGKRRRDSARVGVRVQAGLGAAGATLRGRF